ncbi:MAG: hypothetical protein ACOYXU_05715 [Nitrospirota bacterium]
MALAFAAVASPAMAANLFTINETSGTGVAGSELFVPTFISSSDATGIGGTFTLGGIYIPYMGTMSPCSAPIGATSAAGCGTWGQASIQAWAAGVYHDAAFGTPFIPPSGDHHRTGYQVLLQPSFSGGQWLSGFTPFLESLPFFSAVGSAGPGGDLGLALADSSAELGLVGILGLLDSHGAPVTSGRFPWSFSRQAMPDTLVVKYVAGGGDTDLDMFSQSLRTVTGASRNPTAIRWRAQSNLDGAFSASPGQNSDGCGGSWCEFYVTEDPDGAVHLWVVKGADGDTDTADGTPVEITQSTRLDPLQGIANSGWVLANFALDDVEKLPIVIDDRMAQYSTGTGVGAGEFEQQLLSQFRMVSGPNVHSEEVVDPYSWVICGTRGASYGEEDCMTSAAALDSGGNAFAIVYEPNTGTIDAGESPITRFGRDLNPRRVGNTLYPSGTIDAQDPDAAQDVTAFVECTAGAPSSIHPTSTCESDPGPDGAYGTVDDGTIYYKEALENGLRGWVRESNSRAYGFLGADTDGTHDGISAANFGLTQLVQQRHPDHGVMVSCLQCLPHDLPIQQDTVTYVFDWPPDPTILQITEPPPDGTTVVPVLP